MIGSVLYATTNGWNFAQSLYFAVDVGFLFGSGAAPESRDSSMLISTAMMVVGCFFVVGALQLYIRGNSPRMSDKKASDALDIV